MISSNRVGPRGSQRLWKRIRVTITTTGRKNEYTYIAATAANDSNSSIRNERYTTPGEEV